MKKSGAERAIQYVGWGLVATALIGCGSTPTSETKIYGGKKSGSTEWLGTVALASPDGRIFCSGTAVNPRLVITAAHCVQGTSSPARLKVYIGEGKEGGKVSPQYTGIKVASSPKYGRNPSGWNDIAYIVLDKSMDLPEEAYIPILTDKAEIKELLQTGVNSRIVGFGNREGGGFGVKYETDAPITSLNDNEVGIGKNGKDSCQGDSGGPAYGQLKSGEWRVYGVVSRGGACGFGGIWGLMNANICWVQKDSGVDLGLADLCEAQNLLPSTEVALPDAASSELVSEF